MPCASSNFDREILLFDKDHAQKADISSRVVSCQFELLRRGGCGAGSLALDYHHTALFTVGDWVGIKTVSASSSSSGGEGGYIYYGRVERIRYTHPAGVQLQLYGAVVQLSEQYPGGYVDPRRFGGIQNNSADPDNSVQISAIDSGSLASVYQSVFNLISSGTDITIGTVQPAGGISYEQLLFRGDESALTILKSLAMWSNDASYGVDENRKLFLLQKARFTSTLQTYQAGSDCLLTQETSRDLLYNDLEIVGGWHYENVLRGDVNSYSASDPLFNNQSDIEYVGQYQYRNRFVRGASINTYGRKPIRLFLPHIRRHNDAKDFATKFLAVYGQPRHVFTVQVPGEFSQVRPWLGKIRVNDHLGRHLITARTQAISYQFDHAPVLTFTLGVADPKELWPGAEFDYAHAVGGDGQGGYFNAPSSEAVTTFGQSDVTLSSQSYSSQSGC